MRRINKTNEDDFFIDFRREHPHDTWNQFKNHNHSDLYRQLKEHICNDQEYLCAYCEIGLNQENPHEIRVEHFKSKSGANVRLDNWHLEWENLLCVCLGGEKDSANFVLPDNLSCDAHKGHFETKFRIADKNWVSKILLPLTLPNGHTLFNFRKDTGELHPNEEYCNSISIDHMDRSQTIAIVNKTIEVLNLNCDRLNKARRQVLFELNKTISTRDEGKIYSLIVRWTKRKPLFFQTTRDILIRECKTCQRIIKKNNI